MRIAIFGLGSIGRRHLNNLLAMNEHEILVYDPEKPIEPFMVTDIETIWQWKPDAALICTPPAIHAGLINQCMYRSGCFVLCEKPLANFDPSVMPYDDLRHFAWRSDRLCVGYQLRWQLQEFRHLVGMEDVSFTIGQDMSKWPSQYQKDILEEFSHEIDAAVFVHGPVEAVAAQQYRQSWQIQLRHVRTYSSIVIMADYQAPPVRFANAKGGTISWAFDQIKNDVAYKAELSAFLDVCRGEPMDYRLCSSVEAVHVCKIIEACRESARDCKVVRL